MTQRRIPITAAICSNRPAQLRDAVACALRVLDQDDSIVVVMDIDPTDDEGLVAHHALTILQNGRNRGLAYSRNRVLKECETRYVIFIDDDIVLTANVADGIRIALESGADVAGARIAADFQERRVPWFLTTGQLHYLGVHNPAEPVSIWGGCMAVDVERARLLGVEFDEKLGRMGGDLGSAEDTTFVRHMVAKGATQAILHNVEVTHRIASERLKFRYLARRAYWQGRSEARRNDAWLGIVKEYRRNTRIDRVTMPKLALGGVYVGAVVIGVLHEYLSVALRRSTRGSAAELASRLTYRT